MSVASFGPCSPLVRQVNPFKLRQFARASGVLAKNDPLDARMIASLVAIMPTQPAQPRAPAIERLAETLAVRRQLSAEKVAAENASRLLEDAMPQRLSRSSIARLAADIDMLDRHLAEIVGSDAALALDTGCSLPCRESDQCWPAR
jgi:transposase